MGVKFVYPVEELSIDLLEGLMLFKLEKVFKGLLGASCLGNLCEDIQEVD